MAAPWLQMKPGDHNGVVVGMQPTIAVPHRELHHSQGHDPEGMVVNQAIRQKLKLSSSIFVDQMRPDIEKLLEASSKAIPEQ
jgi:hypothetical protein